MNFNIFRILSGMSTFPYAATNEQLKERERLQPEVIKLFIDAIEIKDIDTIRQNIEKIWYLSSATWVIYKLFTFCIDQADIDQTVDLVQYILEKQKYDDYYLRKIILNNIYNDKNKYLINFITEENIDKFLEMYLHNGIEFKYKPNLINLFITKGAKITLHLIDKVISEDDIEMYNNLIYKTDFIINKKYITNKDDKCPDYDPDYDSDDDNKCLECTNGNDCYCDCHNRVYFENGKIGKMNS